MCLPQLESKLWDQFRLKDRQRTNESNEILYRMKYN